MAQRNNIQLQVITVFVTKDTQTNGIVNTAINWSGGLSFDDVLNVVSQQAHLMDSMTDDMAKEYERISKR